MNIDDADKKAIEVVPDDKVIEKIFTAQAALMEKYHDIEKRNGCHIPDPPYNLDDMTVQLRLKDMFWRVTEELAEAIEQPVVFSRSDEWRTRWERDGEVRHFFEELADALHFLVEASIIAGYPSELAQRQWKACVEQTPITPDRVTYSDILYNVMLVIRNLGLAANTLKNKPWKQSQMPTDEARFVHELTLAWYHFILLWQTFDFSLQEVWELYCRKNQVNKFRQASKY